MTGVPSSAPRKEIRKSNKKGLPEDLTITAPKVGDQMMRMAAFSLVSWSGRRGSRLKLASDSVIGSFHQECTLL